MRFNPKFIQVEESKLLRNLTAHVAPHKRHPEDPKPAKSDCCTFSCLFVFHGLRPRRVHRQEPALGLRIRPVSSRNPSELTKVVTSERRRRGASLIFVELSSVRQRDELLVQMSPVS